MTPHETALVTVLLERLKKIDSAPNGPEAECAQKPAFIREMLV